MITLAVALLSTAFAGDAAAFVANPRHNSGCRDANDCAGVSVYCYKGKPNNYCTYGSGVGSICRDQSGCGWIGFGSYARKMRCSFDFRRAETDQTVELARPRPPSSGRCVDPWGQPQRRLESQTNGVDHGEGTVVQLVNPRSHAGCRDANDCAGLSVYCYRRSHGNQCIHGNGIGSICRDQSGCGWIGNGSYARKMRCAFDFRRVETGKTAELARPRPPSSGRCVDPWYQEP